LYTAINYCITRSAFWRFCDFPFPIKQSIKAPS
jgi:hypothetical protein